MPTERGLAVLQAIIEDYVTTNEPVGSKVIAQRDEFKVSAATIRNEMAKLEAEGLVVAPHTSAGRIPTEKGYREFVNTLHEVRAISNMQKRAIESVLDATADIDELLRRATLMLSSLTNQLAVLQYPDFGGQRLRHLEFVPMDGTRVLVVLIAEHGEVQQRFVTFSATPTEDYLQRLRDVLSGLLVGQPLTRLGAVLDDVYAAFPADAREDIDAIAAVLDENLQSKRRDRLVVAGTTHLLRAGNDFRGSVLPVLEAIEEQVTIVHLLQSMHQEMPDGEVSVRIGTELHSESLHEASVVSGDYLANERQTARVGVIGPTRMHYSRNMMAVRAISKYLSDVLGQ